MINLSIDIKSVEFYPYETAMVTDRILHGEYDRGDDYPF